MKRRKKSEASIHFSHFIPVFIERHPQNRQVAEFTQRYSLWPSNFRMINPRNVFCGATWPLLTGMFTYNSATSNKKKTTTKKTSLQVNPEVADVASLCWLLLHPLRADRGRGVIPISTFFLLIFFWSYSEFNLPTFIEEFFIPLVCLCVWMPPRRNAGRNPGE